MKEELYELRPRGGGQELLLQTKERRMARAKASVPEVLETREI